MRNSNSYGKRVEEVEPMSGFIPAINDLYKLDDCFCTSDEVRTSQSPFSEKQVEQIVSEYFKAEEVKVVEYFSTGLQENIGYISSEDTYCMIILKKEGAFLRFSLNSFSAAFGLSTFVNLDHLQYFLKQC
jgi:hypothetical protein